MILAVMSDIHSNHIALKACISQIEKIGVDGIIFLGDYVSDCPKPKETLQLINELKKSYQCYFIRGNREEYFLDYRVGIMKNWNYTSYKGSLLYTYEHLDDEVLDWFESLPNHMILEIKDTAPIMLAHGSIHSARELLDENKENTNSCLQEIKTQYMLCGHTHRQCTYFYKGKTLINPGSVGVAIGVSKQAHFSTLEWKNEKWDVVHHQVPYDFETLKQCFFESKLMEKGKVWPMAILKSLETGINYGPLCAKRAYDLAIASDETISGRIVPEKYWITAAKEYGIIV